MEHPNKASGGNGPSDPGFQEQRSESPVPSCLSMKSDFSMHQPLHFSGGNNPFDASLLTEDPSRCAVCEQVLKDPVRITCGHRFCRQCIISLWDQPGSTRDYSCPQCRKRFRTRPVLSPHAALAGPVQKLQQEGFSPAPQRHTLVEATGYLEQTPSPQHLHPVCGEKEPEKQATHSTVPDASVQMGHSHTATGVIPCLNTLPKDDALRKAQEKHKSRLERKFSCIFEGLAQQGSPTLLKKIYTELYITEGEREGVNDEHEVWQVETASRTQSSPDTPINCNDIFNPSPGQEKRIRTVLTKGIAGIGKTVSVQKFILDWAEWKANQDIDFIFLLPFREIHLIKDGQRSLLEFLFIFHPEIKGIGKTILDLCKILFIFDGLDESRLPLDFQNKKYCDVTEVSSLDVLLTNLIRGDLLPSALLWITSRPAAASQIPPECVDRVTEIRGFNDPQKEEYFSKKISDEILASRIIKHVTSSRSLHIMCHIPIFCWIIATVLEQMLSGEDGEQVPTTLTEMYTHFLLIQTNMKNKKYHETNETNSKKLSLLDKRIIMKLGKLAFQQLENGNVIFYEEDLEKCGIDVREASVYSGVCTKIFKEESVIHQEKVYCFVHLTIQEYLAALYVFDAYTRKEVETVAHFVKRKSGSSPAQVSLYDLHKSAMDKALKSKNGHLDVFLRFLLGISVDSNQRLLEGLLTQTESSSQDFKKTIRYLNGCKKQVSSPERGINLLHCLLELNDHSLMKDAQTYLEKPSGKKLTPALCSALAYVLLMSNEVLDELDTSKYNTSVEGYKRLLPALRCFRKAGVTRCKLTAESCRTVTSVLQSADSQLRELDLSYNDLGDSGVKLICGGLMSPHCKLQTLRFTGCKLTEESNRTLASVLQSADSQLRELDLSYNDLGDSGVKLICGGLKSPHCKLQTLRLRECNRTQGCCADLASVLRSLHSELIELDLRDNHLQDSGVELLSAGLEDLNCKLERLGLSGCQVTERGCVSLASALRSNPSHLRELDLSYNHPGDSGVRLLSAGLEDPNCKLEKLIVDHGGECRIKPGLLKYACQLTLDPNTAHRLLSLSEGNRQATRGEEQPYPDHPDRFVYYPQVLCVESLSGRSYWEVHCSGWAEIGVTYKGIGRKARNNDSELGHNEKSWVLRCSDDSYFVRHNNQQTDIPIPPSPSHTVGLYLDWPAGSLSFYSVSSHTRTLLYRVRSTFTEPLYPGFYVWSSSVSLSQLA